MDNFFKPMTKNKVGQVLFYLLNITALVFVCVMFLISLINVIRGVRFLVFVQSVLQYLVYGLLLVSLARIIDLLYVQTEKKCNREKKEDVTYVSVDEEKNKEESE